jgi:hypothetical protein
MYNQTEYHGGFSAKLPVFAIPNKTKSLIV